MQVWSKSVVSKRSIVNLLWKRERVREREKERKKRKREETKSSIQQLRTLRYFDKNELDRVNDKRRSLRLILLRLLNRFGRGSTAYRLGDQQMLR